MSKAYDAIIIGTGIIGCATAFEMSKKGHRTLNIDKNPVAGYGSTSNACAIVRAHYSTYEGVAMAYENFFYWQNWEEYLDADDESGYAQFRNTGTISRRSCVDTEKSASNSRSGIWPNWNGRCRSTISTVSTAQPPKNGFDTTFPGASGGCMTS